MMPLDDDTLSKLLKVKRYERPPQGYFEQFLRDFQERQRSEMLRRSTWRLALDRLATRLGGLLPGAPEWTLSQIGYAGASVGVLVVATVFTINMLQYPGGRHAGQIASTSTPLMEPVTSTASYPSEDRFTLNTQFRLPEVSLHDHGPAPVSHHQPRYILDTRPVSYEPPYRF